MKIGKISEFDVNKDDWRLYIERLEQYFLVNEVKNDLYVPTLITLMGAGSYELLVNLCTPDKPKDKTFLQVVEIMGKHLQPKPSELAERYKFRKRVQQSGETIAEYIAVLKKMSKSCEFGSWLQESLRDQLVCGICSETIRQRLFAEPKLDFARAYSLAISLESAEKDAASVVQGHGRSSGDTLTVDCQAIEGTKWRPRGAASAAGRKEESQQGGNDNGTAREAEPRSVRDNRQRQRTHGGATMPVRARRVAASVTQQQCRACGGSHAASTCRFARYVCRVCNTAGHLRRVCPNLSGQHWVATSADSAVGSESDVSEEVINIDFNLLNLTQCKPFMITLLVQNKELNMECDTGSAISCISYEMYQNLFSSLAIKRCNIVLRYYTGESVHPVGVITPQVLYQNKVRNLDLYVINNGKTALLGRQWIIELGIQLPIVKSACLNKLSADTFNLDAFSSRYCKVFAEGLGRFTGPPVSIYVREGARPVYMRACARGHSHPRRAFRLGYADCTSA